MNYYPSLRYAFGAIGLTYVIITIMHVFTPLARNDADPPIELPSIPIWPPYVETDFEHPSPADLEENGCLTRSELADQRHIPALGNVVAGVAWRRPPGTWESAHEAAFGRLRTRISTRARQICSSSIAMAPTGALQADAVLRASHLLARIAAAQRSRLGRWTVPYRLGSETDRGGPGSGKTAVLGAGAGAA